MKRNNRMKPKAFQSKFRISVWAKESDVISGTSRLQLYILGGINSN